jgi:glucan phosphoethanolaminetransferase (alkaline phosphatase superfamily)
MASVLGVLTAFGLASSAGLNAYIPLLVVALLGRLTDLITLTTPWDALESWWVIGVLAVMLIVEVIADKIPAVDSVNDTIQSFVRPAAGAILFAASGGSISHVHPVLAIICGILAAGGVHAVKATARPVITATTGGMLNPVVSTAEDVVALVVSVLAIAVPILALVLLVLVVSWFVRRILRKRQRQVAAE